MITDHLVIDKDHSFLKQREMTDLTNFTNLSNVNRVIGGKRNSHSIFENSDFVRRDKKAKKIAKKINVYSIPLEGLEDHIDLIREKYFDRIENETKAKEFREKYHKYLRGGYFDLLLLIKEYPDFNLFEYINIDLSIQNLNSSKAKYTRKRTMSMRNNLFLRILLEASYFYSSSSDRNRTILEDMSFLKNHIETFKSIICEREASVTFEIDVEVLFLSILGYKDKARTIVFKFHDYFKNLLNDISDSDSFKGIFENLETICDKGIDNLSNEELIILRKIINNCIKRNFYRGIEFLCYHNNFCNVMTEGRIWKSIVKYLHTENILKIWDLFSNSMYKEKTILRSTLQEEYSKKLKMFKDDDQKLKHENKEKLFEISLGHVYDLKSFLIVIFKCNRNDIANELINHTLIINKREVDLDIFDACLEYDEDIAIELIDHAINSDNAKDYHMKLALMKKYFRLACKLLRYKQCKSYLNLSKPKDDNEEYLFDMNWLSLLEKQKQWDNQERQGFTDKNENTQNYFRLLSLHSKSDEKKENEEEEEVLMDSLKINKKSETFIAPANDLNDDIFPTKFDSHNLGEKFKSLDTINIDKISKLSYHSIVDKLGVVLKQNPSKISENENMVSKSNLTLLEDNDQKPLFPHNRKTSNFREVLKKNENEVEIINFIKKKSTSKHCQITDLQLDYPAENIDMINKIKSRGSLNSVIQEEIVPIKTKYSHKIEEQDEKNPNVKIFDTIGLNKKKDKFLNISFSYLIQSNSPINVQMILIDHLRWGQFTFYCVCLLSSISERYMNSEYSEKICKSLLVFTRDEEAISRCRSPLILCVLTAEFLKKLGNFNIKYQYKCQSIADMFLKLGECLQSSIKDEEMLNYYLREQVDHKNRSALEIIAENRFYDLLNDENVATIVGKLWYGLGRDLSIFKFSRMSRIFGANLRHEFYKDVVSSDLKDKAFSFQYCEYTKNCSVRYLVDSISTITTTILYQLIIYFYVSISRENNDPYEDVFFSNLNWMANIIVFSINLNLLMYLLYVYMTNRTLKINAFILLDIIMFFGVMCNFIKIPNLIYQDDLDSIRYLDAIIYSIIIVCAWMRVIGILMTTRSFGPFLRIIYLLLSTFINFLLVFFGINTVFAQVFTLLFQRTNVDFKGFFSSWITLFNTSFGIHDFTNFTIMEVFGYVLLMSYTTLTSIMLLNLVVAIINNLFHVFEKKADAENRAVLVLTYERIKWDDQYGILILLPAPLNVISFPFIIILILAKDKYKLELNLIFTKICYILISLVVFFLLIIISFVLFPFSYIKSLIHSVYDQLGSGKFSSKDLFVIFLNILTRPFIFLFYILEDIKNYWKLCYKDNQLEYKENKKNYVNRDVILALRKVLLDFRFEQKKKIISIDELYSRLKLNRRQKSSKVFITNKTDSSIEILDSNNISVNRSMDDNTSQNVSPQPSFRMGHESVNTGSRKTDNISDLSFSNNENVLSYAERNIAFKYLIDKIVDKERFIEIDRTLFILPSRVKYTDQFIRSINYLNMRVILRGLQKFSFLNAVINPVYSYKKLQQLIYKIIIKFKMIYQYLPENQINNLRNEFDTVNHDENYSKNFENMIKMEQHDELSDYDDQFQLEEMAKSPQKMSSKKISSESMINPILSDDNSPPNNKK